MSTRNPKQYLEVLEKSANERLIKKEKLEEEYFKNDEMLSSAEKELDSAENEYHPVRINLEPLEKRRDYLNTEIKERKTKIDRLKKELAKLETESEKLLEEVEPMRKDIKSLQGKYKNIRDRYYETYWKHYHLENKQTKLKQDIKENDRLYSEAFKQYWLALQLEKRKPVTIILIFLFVAVTIFIAVAWVGKQVPFLVFITSIVFAFTTFFLIIMAWLRQDEKLKEESFFQLARDLIGLISSFFKKTT
ncbi:MAG: hypothetical protein J0L96_14785 [Anaerolineae bacterium]|nr:hypothetical protein [Anaerolineae bacterium]